MADQAAQAAMEAATRSQAAARRVTPAQGTGVPVGSLFLEKDSDDEDEVPPPALQQFSGTRYPNSCNVFVLIREVFGSD